MHDVLYDEDMRCNKCIQNIIYEGFTNEMDAKKKISDSKETLRGCNCPSMSFESMSVSGVEE